MKGARYFTGKPCKNGHLSERSVANRTCLECHKEKMNARQTTNRENARTIDKKYYDNRTPERKRFRQVIHHKYRAEGELSHDIYDVLFAKQNGLCNMCADPFTKTADIDHILGIRNGGLNVDSNVQLLCRSCNVSKGS